MVKMQSDNLLPQRRNFFGAASRAVQQRYPVMRQHEDFVGCSSIVNYENQFVPKQPNNIFRDLQSCATENFTADENVANGFKIRPNSLLAKLGLPCQIDQDYDYGQCYSYYANGCYNTCQFVDVGDIEDFMNNEKRKEKSRDAARSRRSRETEIFTDLANALPLTSEQISQLDKASVMRLAISYLRVRNMVNLVPELKAEENTKSTDGSVFLKSLEGFLLVLSPEGDFVYLSENVSDYLGISQIDLMGQNVFEYSHPCDHDEIREILSGKSQDDTDSPKSMFIRLKCTLTSKGRSVNLKSATYKVIHCTGHIVKPDKDLKKDNNDKGSMHSCFVAVGQPIPHPSNIEAPLPRQTFLTKHSLDMKFTHADDEFMKNVLGYDPDDLLGKSVYEYHHAMDSDSICSAYKCLFSKGQCETNRYRFLAKTGGYVWVVTQATLIYDKMQKPQSIVCVNYVISGVECKDEIYSASQFSSVKSESSINSTNTVPEIVLPVVDNTKVLETTDEKPVAISAKLFESIEPLKESDIAPRPQTTTTKIFGPRTKDMNKGFLTFSEEEPGLTMLKDEPDDLTHLAPVCGDVCVPLEEHPFLSDMLDDFLLKDNFGPLLTEEPSDPFISYRDFHDPSPQLLSPNLSKNSDCSLPSLNSPSDSLIDEDQMSTFMNLQMEDEPELVLKAPFIPMNLTEDLPLLMSNDLMWSNNEKNKNQLLGSNSSLAQLLSTSLNKHSLKANDHGGGLLQEQSMEEIYNEKNTFKSWNRQNKNNSQINRIERTPGVKRSSTTMYDQSNKRTRVEPKEKMSSELLQQLMSNNHNRGRPKGKSNWLLDNGSQKAACISQPSDSVLMNLLDDPMNEKVSPTSPLEIDVYALKRIQLTLEKDQEKVARQNQIRKNSMSLLEPEATGISSLMDLTQQDFEVNAPVGAFLLQGEEILSALDVNSLI